MSGKLDYEVCLRSLQEYKLVNRLTNLLCSKFVTMMKEHRGIDMYLLQENICSISYVWTWLIPVTIELI